MESFDGYLSEVHINLAGSKKINAECKNLSKIEYVLLKTHLKIFFQIIRQDLCL